MISIDVNTAAVEEKGALAAVYEQSELPTTRRHGFTSSCVTHR